MDPGMSLFECLKNLNIIILWGSWTSPKESPWMVCFAESHIIIGSQCLQVINMAYMFEGSQYSRLSWLWDVSQVKTWIVCLRILNIICPLGSWNIYKVRYGWVYSKILKLISD